MNEETQPPFELFERRKISMPMALLLGLLATTAAGAVAWSVTRAQVERNSDAIVEIRRTADNLQGKVSADHDVLIEIRADVKRLLLHEERKP